MANHKIITPFILKKEGGLSRAKTDTASKKPSPYTITARDINQRGNPLVTASDWHTNKGITWATFTGLATKIGYQVNQLNWEKMPQNIWDGIFKKGYWDELSLDQINNQALANVAADFAWGAGPSRAAERLQMAVNTIRPNALVVDGNIGPTSVRVINSFKGTQQKKLFEIYSASKDQFYKSLPKQEANQKGWENRHNELVEFSLKYLPAVGIGLVGITGLFFWGYGAIIN